MKAKTFLRNKGIKDTLYDEKVKGYWRKGGLSALLDEYADSKVKNLNKADVSKSVGDMRRDALISHTIHCINSSTDAEIDKIYEQLKELFK